MLEERKSGSCVWIPSRKAEEMARAAQKGIDFARGELRANAIAAWRSRESKFWARLSRWLFNGPDPAELTDRQVWDLISDAHPTVDIFMDDLEERIVAVLAGARCARRMCVTVSDIAAFKEASELTNGEELAFFALGAPRPGFRSARAEGKA